ncbi:hypothetical protein Pden_0254 [Paracoccus denitrificans PD1222]|uniref:Uncharacterized protein n=1 Tax=Paracoccus denitrificans (strain Pd 1222) TaxID=318586 RepID=A1AYM4_PARDP|nr:hypothetical protein Pden_0254 [Paracoccus denitrificans PD1222]
MGYIMQQAMGRGTRLIASIVGCAPPQPNSTILSASYAQAPVTAGALFFCGQHLVNIRGLPETRRCRRARMVSDEGIWEAITVMTSRAKKSGA